MKREGKKKENKIKRKAKMERVEQMYCTCKFYVPILFLQVLLPIPMPISIEELVASIWITLVVVAVNQD